MDELTEFKYVPTEQELEFAHVLARSGDYATAWLEAGYPDKGQALNHRSGYTLSKKDRIQERVEFAKLVLAQKSNLSDVQVVGEFKDIGFANMMNYMDKDMDDIDLSQCTREQMAAVKKVKITQTEFGVIKEIQLHDKLPALDRLAKILNLYERNNQASAPKIILELGNKEVINVIEQ